MSNTEFLVAVILALGAMVIGGLGIGVGYMIWG